MAEHKVLVERLTIQEHPNADKLEVAQVGDYQSLVMKGEFETGDLAAYIPEASLVPQDILKELGLEGRLAGSDHNRVKAIRLRGVLSQGICYPAKDGWEEGDDVTEELGITKYEPPIPASMSGEVYAAGGRRCMKYDIENIKRYPGVLKEGEDVVITEKIHGTWCQIGVIPEQLAYQDYGRLVVCSKGLGSKGLAFKPNAEQNKNNLYLRVARHLGALERLAHYEIPIFVMGEVFGSGVQDLGYGAHTKTDETLGFRVFDVYEGQPGHGRYLNDDELTQFCEDHGFERVPVLYRGPFSKAKVLELTTGAETVSGEEAHIREGVVVRPLVERRDLLIGRVQLKSVSDDYLLRRDGTELT